MRNLRNIELLNILPELPDIELLEVNWHFSNKSEDIFFCALGFEDRCSWISEQIYDVGSYKTREAILFEYATNINDNDLNRTRLIEALKGFSTSVNTLYCDKINFTSRLREVLQKVGKVTPLPYVTIDISSFSSKLLLLVLKVFIEFNINLRIVYSEAAIYHPTREEYDADPQKWTTEEGFGIAKGVGKVIRSPEHPGNRRDLLPETIIVFPTFKPERTKAVIAEIDESILTRPEDRLIWIVGKPHLHEDYWRAQVLREINKIPASAPCYEVTTFDYKKTMEILDRIYTARDCKYHITISPLGSKLQALGIALYWYIRQDISIVFAVPKEFNARQYSEGCKATWKIEFGNLKDITNILDMPGKLEIII